MRSLIYFQIIADNDNRCNIGIIYAIDVIALRSEFAFRGRAGLYVPPNSAAVIIRGTVDILQY